MKNAKKRKRRGRREGKIRKEEREMRERKTKEPVEKFVLPLSVRSEIFDISPTCRNE